MKMLFEHLYEVIETLRSYTFPFAVQADIVSRNSRFFQAFIAISQDPVRNLGKDKLIHKVFNFIPR